MEEISVKPNEKCLWDFSYPKLILNIKYVIIIIYKKRRNKNGST